MLSGAAVGRPKEMVQRLRRQVGVDQRDTGTTLGAYSQGFESCGLDTGQLEIALRSNERQEPLFEQPLTAN